MKYSSRDLIGRHCEAKNVRAKVTFTWVCSWCDSTNEVSYSLDGIVKNGHVIVRGVHAECSECRRKATVEF